MRCQTSETQGRNPDRPAYLNSFYQSRGRNHTVTGRLTLRSFFLVLSSLGGTEPEPCHLSQEIPTSACCCCTHSPARLLVSPLLIRYPKDPASNSLLPAAPGPRWPNTLGSQTDRGQSTGLRSDLLCAIYSKLLSPATPTPGSQPPRTSGCEFIWKVSADISKTAGPALTLRSILKQGLSQCATQAALNCNLRSSASQVLGLQG